MNFVVDFFQSITINSWCIVGLGIVLFLILILIFRSPFKYPYFTYEFDVSGRRQPKIEDLIDEFLISGGFYRIQQHEECINKWKQECEKRIENSVLKTYRRNQYKQCLNDSNAFRFAMMRRQTRYKQVNYVKQAYQVSQCDGFYAFGFNYLQDRDQQLKAIGYEATLSKYNSKKQRNLMTSELRKQIMIRDNYTCQICGKYMPDEVGLQIDHIKPIAKGGKTMPSNLQVLCSKCNGNKYDKY